MLEASKEMMKILLAAVFASAALWAGPAEIARAADLYHRTKYQEAFRIIQPVLGNDPSAHSLAGKCQYMVGDFKKATELFADPDFDGDPVQIYEPKHLGRC